MKSKGNPEIILEAKGITKDFPGVRALNNVNFRVYKGKVNAMVGENGAGKSTLMNILSAVYTGYEGELYFNGEKIVLQNTADAMRMGIAIIHQELNLVPGLTVAENIFLGREPRNRFGLIDYTVMKKRAGGIVKTLQLRSGVDAKISDLRVGQQQIVEIAKALSINARVLIMDEPTSALTESETGVLFDLIGSLTVEGVSIVYITHKMDELFEVADHVTVLRDGRLIKELPMAGITADELIKLMVGREAKDFFVKKQHKRGKAVLEIESLSVRHPVLPGRQMLKNISFRTHASEVLGIYGLMGSGRTVLLETLFGLHFRHLQAGIKIDGKNVILRDAGQAIKNGIALIPEDRKKDGLVLQMNIAQNISLASLKKYVRRGFLNLKKEARHAGLLRHRMDIRSYSVYQDTGKLSGGNQQKVVLAKWLATGPRILLLDEPTRGIDINAKNEIYKLIDELAGNGMAVVLVSSELPEIMAISDRIITLSNGKLTRTFERKEFTEENILKAVLPEFKLN